MRSRPIMQSTEPVRKSSRKRAPPTRDLDPPPPILLRPVRPTRRAPTPQLRARTVAAAVAAAAQGARGGTGSPGQGSSQSAEDEMEAGGPARRVGTIFHRMVNAPGGSGKIRKLKPPPPHPPPRARTLASLVCMAGASPGNFRGSSKTMLLYLCVVSCMGFLGLLACLLRCCPTHGTQLL